VPDNSQETRAGTWIWRLP